ncbi:4-hydroxy-tetrahydrodipicolinate synthase [Lentzea aerocolonigenes]|uniref:4-hydroxy-tetrahydrodipicolinate synthase n=1 Tax=Lentzea aerocolonigenes TaxID=68170 RepID=UPI0004C32004|nr:4-hydroxy-tetrahydrodipicolinate synthase [Lentzea aerocolonigenes]MCP2247939.1 4-hydroxy-tetrahydrodipicolinate synthase [Lentzea aerocolonigenes]
MFGRVLVAMVTPFTPDGDLDLKGAQELAAHLVDKQRVDGLVLNGTTGEAPTTTDEEKAQVIRAVKEAVGERTKILAGVGTNSTRHTIELARQAEENGADGLLVVTPYYSRPTQEGVENHFRQVANASGLPALLYDIPGRTATAIETDTLMRLAEHPRIVGVKDCKVDLLATAKVIAETGLDFYSGNDELILPLYSIGGVGTVSTVGHVVGSEIKAMLDAYDEGDNKEALRRHQALLPVITAIMTREPGAVAVKAALNLLGLPAGPVREPLAEATPKLIDELQALFV